MPSTEQPVRYYRYKADSGWSSIDARVITEATIMLTVNGVEWLSFTCTPSDLEALAVGFLFNEGIIQTRDEIAAVDVCKQGTNIDVWLSHPAAQPRQWRRTSGCTGGLTATEDVARPVAAVSAAASLQKIPPQTLLDCMEQLLEVQNLYREVRGVHCSGISDGQVIRVKAEDIGRHNTLDKLAGLVLLNDIQIQRPIVATTGRVSSEMLQKSAQLRAIAVVSRTSPTSQSVSEANRLGITLVGYARRNQFQCYAHPERLDI